MTQYVDKSALVAEINKRIMEAPIDCYGHQRVWAYNDVKDILNTLEVKEVEKEPKCMFTKDSYTDGDRKVLCEDCEEKCEYSKKEEPVSEELEEACEQLAENARKHKAETLSPFFSQTDYKQGVIDGAKWQNKQMMKDAVDGVVHHYGDDEIAAVHYNDPKGIPMSYFVSSKGLSAGDKVKLIIIKQEEN